MALLEGGESDEGKDSPPVSSSRLVDVPCEARWMRSLCKSLSVRSAPKPSRALRKKERGIVIRQVPPREKKEAEFPRKG